MPRLEIQSGKAAGQVVELKSSTVTIGNRRNATIEIKDSWVSFNHAEISRQGDAFYITDARSKAGTFVNGRKIDRTPAPLQPGDTILLGKTEIKFVADAAQAASASAPAPAPSAPATPAPPPAPTVPTEILEKVARLERDLTQAERDLTTLRQTHIVREKALAETNEKLRTLEKGASEAAHWKRTAEEWATKGRVKIEELTRYARQLEAQVKAGGGNNSALLEKEQEITRLREELRVRASLPPPAPLGANAPGVAANPEELAHVRQELEDTVKRAEEAEKSAGTLEKKVEELEGSIRELRIKLDAPHPAEKELKTLKAELAGYESALAERNKDVERLEALLGGDAPPPASQGGASSEELSQAKAEAARLKARAEELEKHVIDLRTQVEEINKDMLDLEDELRAEISELEKKLAETSKS